MDQTMSAGAAPNNNSNASGVQEPPLSEQDQIQFIVEQVNSVLGKGYSLVEFDDLAPLALLQTLADIFRLLSAKDFVDFGEVPVEAGAMKLMEFLLRTLGYKVPPLIQRSFAADFTQGDKSVLYPVLFWVLKRMPENRKRVYLALYLSRIDVPEDLRVQDDGIRELYQRFEALRNDFIEVHKRVDALREASADPTEARRKISLLESERDKLQQSITAATKKLNAVPNRDALVAACKMLREEQTEEAKLRQKTEDQQRAMIEADRKNRDAQSRLRDVKRDIADQRIEAVVQRMSDDLRANRMLLEQKLPGELNERRVKCAALQKLAAEPLDLPGLQAELSTLDRECQVLAALVQKRNQTGEDGTNIVAMKQQVQRVVSKKTESMAEMQQLQEKNNALLEVIREKTAQLDRFRQSKVLKGEDFKKYSNQVRAKAAAASNMKRRLADLRTEFGILQYTEKLLKERHEELQGDLTELEEKLGAIGFVARSEHLNKVSEEKAQVEQVKAATLEELSVIVQNLVNEIHKQKDQLAPRIVELRNARNASQAVEQDWEEKRSAYQYQQGVLMQEVSKLETEVTSMAEEARLSESIYHRLQCQLSMLKVQLKRVEDEKDFRAGTKTLDPTARTYTQLYHSSTDNLEQKNKIMQKRRRDIEENHESRLQQVEYFTALRKLLEAKVASLNGGGGAPIGTSIDHDIQRIMNVTSTQGGVDRIVFRSD